MAEIDPSLLFSEEDPIGTEGKDVSSLFEEDIPQGEVGRVSLPGEISNISLTPDPIAPPQLEKVVAPGANEEGFKERFKAGGEPLVLIDPSLLFQEEEVIAGRSKADVDIDPITGFRLQKSGKFGSKFDKNFSEFVFGGKTKEVIKSRLKVFDWWNSLFFGPNVLTPEEDMDRRAEDMQLLTGGALLIPMTRSLITDAALMYSGANLFSKIGSPVLQKIINAIPKLGKIPQLERLSTAVASGATPFLVREGEQQAVTQEFDPLELAEQGFYGGALGLIGESILLKVSNVLKKAPRENVERLLVGQKLRPRDEAGLLKKIDAAIKSDLSKADKIAKKADKEILDRLVTNQELVQTFGSKADIIKSSEEALLPLEVPEGVAERTVSKLFQRVDDTSPESIKKFVKGKKENEFLDIVNKKAPPKELKKSPDFKMLRKKFKFGKGASEIFNKSQVRVIDDIAKNKGGKITFKQIRTLAKGNNSGVEMAGFISSDETQFVGAGVQLLKNKMDLITNEIDRLTSISAKPVKTRMQKSILRRVERLKKKPNKTQKDLDRISSLESKVVEPVGEFDITSPKGSSYLNNRINLFEQDLDRMVIALGSQGTHYSRVFRSLGIMAEGKGNDKAFNALVKEMGKIEKLSRREGAILGKEWNKIKATGDKDALIDFYNSKIKPTFFKKLTEFRMFNMLSSTATWTTNMSSNAIQAVVPAVEKTVLASSDWFLEVTTGKAREFYVKEAGLYLKGSIGSFRSAVKEASDVMRGIKGIERFDLGRVPALPKRVLGVIPVRAVTQFPFKVLEATDIFFRTVVEGGEREALTFANKMAGLGLTKQGIKRVAAQKAAYRIFRQGLGSPQEGSLFKSMDKLTNDLLKMRERNDIFGKSMSFLAPFVQTPTNILKQGIESSPFGVFTLKGAANKAEQLAKIQIGGLAMAVGATFAISGRATWDVPTNRKARADFFAANRRPRSFRIGDTWIQFDKMGPLAWPLALPAAMHQKFLDNEKFSKNDLRKSGELMLSAFSGMMGIFGELPYMQGLNGLYESIEALGDADGRAKQQFDKFVAGNARQLIPAGAALNWINSVADDFYRNPDGIIETIMAGLPILSRQVPPHIKSLDNSGLVEKSDRGSLGLKLTNAFSPFRISLSDPEFEDQFKETIEKVRESMADNFDKRASKKTKERNKAFGAR